MMMMMKWLKAIALSALLAFNPAVAWSQNVGEQAIVEVWAGTSGGSANVQTASIPNLNGPLRAGYLIHVLPGFTNTGATTFNFNSLGAKNVFKQGAAGAVALTGGEIQAGSGSNANALSLLYDGTQFQLLNVQSGATYAPQGAVKNLVLTVTGNTSSTGSADAIVVANGSGSSITGGFSCTINWATTGVNGLDTGSLVASAWYYVWAIYNGSAFNCLGSGSSSAPILPSGYTYEARVGAIPTDSSSHLMRVLQKGHSAQYVVTAATNTANLPIVASGSSGNVSTPTWTSISLSAAVPPTASRVRGALTGSIASSGALILAPNNSYGAIGSTSNPPPIAFSNPTVSALATGTAFDFELESGAIFWAASTTGGVVVVIGWDDTNE